MNKKKIHIIIIVSALSVLLMQRSFAQPGLGSLTLNFFQSNLKHIIFDSTDTNCFNGYQIANSASVGVNGTYTGQMNTLRTNAQSIDKSLNNPLINVIKMNDFNTYKP